MAKTKILLEIPEELNGKIVQKAETLMVSRADIIRMACKEFLG